MASLLIKPWGNDMKEDVAARRMRVKRRRASGCCILLARLACPLLASLLFPQPWLCLHLVSGRVKVGEGKIRTRESTLGQPRHQRRIQLMIAAVVQVSLLVWKLKTLRLSHHNSLLSCGCVFVLFSLHLCPRPLVLSLTATLSCQWAGGWRGRRRME